MHVIHNHHISSIFSKHMRMYVGLPEADWRLFISLKTDWQFECSDSFELTLERAFHRRTYMCRIYVFKIMNVTPCKCSYRIVCALDWNLFFRIRWWETYSKIPAIFVWPHLKLVQFRLAKEANKTRLNWIWGTVRKEIHFNSFFNFASHLWTVFISTILNRLFFSFMQLLSN